MKTKRRKKVSKTTNWVISGVNDTIPFPTLSFLTIRRVADAATPASDVSKKKADDITKRMVQHGRACTTTLTYYVKGVSFRSLEKLSVPVWLSGSS